MAYKEDVAAEWDMILTQLRKHELMSPIHEVIADHLQGLGVWPRVELLVKGGLDQDLVLVITTPNTIGHAVAAYHEKARHCKNRIAGLNRRIELELQKQNPEQLHLTSWNRSLRHVKTRQELLCIEMHFGFVTSHTL